MVKKPRPPAGIGDAGKALWNSITGQVADDGLVLDVRELRLLRDACHSADDLARLEAELGSADLVVKGSQGQPVVNGLFSEVRACRSQIAALLKQIRLTDEDAGRPLGGLPSTQAARAAANQRHHGSAYGVGQAK
ncbi:hypothetical protein P3H15_33210 [Rhodococcus sp. T2V]|uniref:hypothetical protein n=1 Tax=Rhodococcus sp. T2V TaxID=3034164 RepID=UPI0023E28266|nr:hypothetical protein [Rhodococcus sp. T2V]MDF3309879.1 hypothetical protein [Rhodococcus sp. T2V]